MFFFILGCNGMAGHIISLYLKEQGHSVLGFARTKSRYVESIVGDAFDTELIRRVIEENKFDAVVNCIGMLNHYAEEDKASASFINSYLPHFLAKITVETKTQIVHMSTDCVFSGKRGSYTEADFCDGETFYDRSKALGELVDCKNITLRNSIVGPDIYQKGIGLFNWFMQQSVEINGFTKSIWTGQTTLQLAKTIENAVLQKAYGLYNAVPDHSISKYELVKLFNHYFKDDTIKINPIDGILADKSLIRTRYEFDCLIPDYETMIAELAEWMKNHKDMYSHYNLSNYKL
jgi:dTDP-4-dehydrorhamnose reductase